jgi:hypothetical protein
MYFCQLTTVHSAHLCLRLYSQLQLVCFVGTYCFYLSRLILKDGPKPGAISCRQGEEAWKMWKAGRYGNVSLSDGVIEFAKTHEEIKGAFLTFQKDADQIYPGLVLSLLLIMILDIVKLL